MRSLLRFSLLALALAAGCGQKGPLALKAPPGRTPVAAAAASTAPGAATPATAAPAAGDKKDPADDQPTAPRR